MRIAVVGGGISGLAAAWELRNHAEVTIYESHHLGGRIRTTAFGDHLVEEGPDAFIVRSPDAVQLCREVGIESDLVSPAAGRALLWFRGNLRPIPDGLFLGVPRELGGVLRSRILSPLGMARAALDLVLPRGRAPATLTVRELVASRFGAQVADRLVDPLVGGIHAGSTATLGAAEVTPVLVSSAVRSRSLLQGLRGASAADGGPIFAAPRQGLGHLVDTLVAQLESSGSRFLTDQVQRVLAGSGSQVLLEPDPTPYDGAVIATSSRDAAPLLGQGSGALAEIRTASVAVVTMAFAGALAADDISGFLVPRTERRLMTACSFASNKWPHWADDGASVVRVSAGRDGDATALDLDDDRLVDRLVDELGEALHQPISPTRVRVSRWPDAFPQYQVGHAGRVAEIESELRRRLPTVALAGASYHGAGLPACVASGRRAARAVLARVLEESPTRYHSAP